MKAIILPFYPKYGLHYYMLFMRFWGFYLSKIFLYVAIFATVLQMQLVHYLHFKLIVNDIEGFCGYPLLYP